MKKIFALALVVAMMLAMSVSVFAFDIEANNGSASKEITVNNTVTYDPQDVYAVNVEWTTTNFALESASGIWDPENHVYKDGEQTTFASGKNTGTVTVINHSNVAIDATIALSSTDSNITFTADEATKEIAEADAGESLGDKTKAPKAVFTVTGAVAEDYYTTAASITVTATVTIAKK